MLIVFRILRDVLIEVITAILIDQESLAFVSETHERVFCSPATIFTVRVIKLELGALA